MKSISTITLLLVHTALFSQHLFTTPINASDVGSFWRAFDELEKDTTKNPFEHYISTGTPGLMDLNHQMIGGAVKLKKHVLQRIGFYRSARSVSSSWQDYIDKVNYVSQQLTVRVPGIRFPTVYLAIGIENCGSTMSANGIIIGLETLCYLPGEDPLGLNRSMENLPEMIATVVIWHNLTGDWDDSLLCRVIASGSAEFFTKQAVRDLKIKYPMWSRTDPYGEAHRCALWKKFVEDRNQKITTGWFWEYNKDVPANLGEWMGFTIVSEYFKVHQANPDVMQNCLNLTLLKQFVEDKMVLEYCGSSPALLPGK